MQKDAGAAQPVKNMELRGPAEQGFDVGLHEAGGQSVWVVSQLLLLSVPVLTLQLLDVLHRLAAPAEKVHRRSKHSHPRLELNTRYSIGRSFTLGRFLLGLPITVDLSRHKSY